MKNGALFFLCLFFVGCLESGGLEQIATPNVNLSCDQDQVANCFNAAGQTVYLGLLRSGRVNCESYLAQIPSGNFAAFFDLSGTATTAYASPTTTATVTTWVNTEGFGIAQVDDTLHQLCAFIDTNGNGRVDSNEPAADGTLSTSSPGTVDTWFNF